MVGVYEGAGDLIHPLALPPSDAKIRGEQHDYHEQKRSRD